MSFCCGGREGAVATLSTGAARGLARWLIRDLLLGVTPEGRRSCIACSDLDVC
jgi:hypothetical protein